VTKKNFPAATHMLYYRTLLCQTKKIPNKFFLHRDMLEAGSVWRGKLLRIEGNNARLYLVRDRDLWGWVISER
jgi:hypothetical protein